MLKKTISIIVALGIILSLAVLPANAYETYETYPWQPIIGDLSGDWIVEIDDVTYLQRRLAEIEIPYYCEEIVADVDEDSAVTILDATHIQRWLLGMNQEMNIANAVYYWYDKTTAEKAEPEDRWTCDVIIDRIYHDYCYAYAYAPLIEWYKFRADLSDDWCVGDHVECSIELLYMGRSADDWCAYEVNLLSIEPSNFVLNPYEVYKPVIYLYPEEETEVDVKLTLDGTFTHTYPKYQDGWTVTASPDGTLTDANGKTYPYLFWEANLNTDYDLSKGFCVKSEDTESFLTEKLAVQGLSENEIAEFLEFWLPHMQKNPYNVISFQTDAYTDAAALSITPQPDSLIRVFMTWYASDQMIDIPAQELIPAERTGFTAVEWGGQMLLPDAGK